MTIQIYVRLLFLMKLYMHGIIRDNQAYRPYDMGHIKWFLNNIIDLLFMLSQIKLFYKVPTIYLVLKF